jgi:DNA-binding NarL/FixJ family response regulator
VITVLLAEDHTIVRQGVRLVLEREPDLTVVGEVDDGRHVADVCARLEPDVLLLDLGLPGLHGLEVIDAVTGRVPRTRVLVLSMHAHAEWVLGAMARGASGYLLKGCEAPELVTAIRRIAAGERYVSADVAHHLRGDRSAPERREPYSTLTPREREVMHLMARGLSNITIAEQLHVSPRTVETHRANVMRKLDLRNQTDVVLFAVRRGLVNAT